MPPTAAARVADRLYTLAGREDSGSFGPLMKWVGFARMSLVSWFIGYIIEVTVFHLDYHLINESLLNCVCGDLQTPSKQNLFFRQFFCIDSFSTTRLR